VRKRKLSIDADDRARGGRGDTRQRPHTGLSVLPESSATLPIRDPRCRCCERLCDQHLYETVVSTVLDRERRDEGERTANDVLSIARKPASRPWRSVDKVLELVLYVEVWYPRWSSWRKLKVGGFFVVGGRFWWRGGKGEVADAAVVLVDDEGTADKSALVWNVDRGGRSTKDERSVRVELEVLDGGRNTDVFRPEPLRARLAISRGREDMRKGRRTSFVCASQI
jgi:hypothetical protein